MRWSLPVGLVAVAVIVSVTPASAAAPPAGWSAPVVLGHLQSNTGYGASTVATAANGSAVAVWSAVQGHTYRYLAATKAPGKAWSAPHVLAQKVQDGRIFAGISSTGRATVVWTLGIATGTVHYATHAGSRWSANRVLAGTAGLDATSFTTAPNGYGVLAGNKLVKVNPSKPVLSIAYVRKLTPAGKWGPTLRVSGSILPKYQGKTHAATGAGDVQAAIDNAGSVTAAWGWSYFSDPSGAYSRLQRNSVGAGGKVGKVVSLKPTPRYEAGVESVQMSPSGAAAIVWNDDESKTAYVLVKTPTGPWVSTTRDISALGIADDKTFVVSDNGLSEYWVKVTPGSGSSTLTLQGATFSTAGWSSPTTLDTDTLASSDEIRSDGLSAAATSGDTFLLWGTEDVTAFLAHQSSTTARLTSVTSTGTSTEAYPAGTTGEAVSADGTHATALISRDVPGAIGPDLTAVTR